MALPIHDYRTQTLDSRRPGRPHLVLVEGSGDAAPDSPNRVRRPIQVSSGRTARSTPSSVYRRRRLTVVASAALLCLLVSLGAARFNGAGAAATPREDAVVRVRPGETLWSIAGSLESGRDLRSVVTDISAANDGRVDIDAGQDLVIPADLAGHLDRR